MTGRRGPRRPGDVTAAPERGRDPARTTAASGEYRIDPLVRSARAELELDRESPISASGAALGETRLLDDDLCFEDDATRASALDLATMHPPPLAGAERGDDATVPALRALPGEAVAAFAGYPRAPTSLVEAPFHALVIVLRRRELASARALARVRAAAEVPLYDAAIAAADLAAVRRGLAVTIGVGASFVAAAVVLAELLSTFGP